MNLERAGYLSPARRVVIKIGSSLLTDGKKREIRTLFLKRLAGQVCCLQEKGIQCLIVTSGAIAAGCKTTAFLVDDDVLIDAGTGVGDLALDKDGIALRGLVIRLLVLPDDLSGTRDTLKFIKENVSGNAYLSIMSQYYPTFKANDYKELSRGITIDEYKNIVDEAGRPRHTAPDSASD